MKHIRPAIGLTAFFIVLFGLLFPIVVWAIAQVTMPKQANGSLISEHGVVIGSSLIGQNFTASKYLHPRPSAAGSGYDANNSGGTNLGPTNPKLLEGDKDNDGIKKLANDYRTDNGLPPDTVLPADAVTRSASGLDPDISPENAKLQAARIAKARGMTVEEVQSVIDACTSGPAVGVFGDPIVNVLQVNLRLDRN